MALKVSFGQGGKPTQWYLPGTNTALLPAGPANGQKPVADALTDGPYAPSWDDAPLFGGLVRADTFGGTAQSFDVAGGWNSVKNAFAQGSGGSNDLDGDGLAEILALDGQNGYVIWGKADGAAVALADIAAGIGGFQAFGEGAAFVPAGDMNGDGLPEIMTALTGSAHPAAFVVFLSASWLHGG